MKKRSEERKRQRTRGESMVIAIVLMLVFFVLGLAVMTGASVANASVSARLRYRQAYYYARSVLDLLDDSIRGTDGLGDYIRDAERQAWVTANLPSGSSLTATRSRTLTLDGLPEGVSLDGPVLLTYEVVILEPTAGELWVSLGDVKLSYTVEYAGLGYETIARYTYLGIYENNAWDVAESGWQLRGLS